MKRQFLITAAILVSLGLPLWFRQASRQKQTPQMLVVMIIQTPWPLQWLNCGNLQNLGLKPCRSVTLEDFEPEPDARISWQKIFELWQTPQEGHLWSLALANDVTINFFSNALPIGLEPKHGVTSVRGYPLAQENDWIGWHRWRPWVENQPKPWVIWFVEIQNPESEEFLEKQLILDLAILNEKFHSTSLNWVIWQISFPSQLITNQTVPTCPCSTRWISSFFQSMEMFSLTRRPPPKTGSFSFEWIPKPPPGPRPQTQPIEALQPLDLGPRHQAKLALIQAVAKQWLHLWLSQGWDWSQMKW